MNITMVKCELNLARFLDTNVRKFQTAILEYPGISDQMYCRYLIKAFEGSQLIIYFSHLSIAQVYSTKFGILRQGGCT